MAAGISANSTQPGMIGVPNRNARTGYNEPATGSPVDFPLNGVDASQQYNTASEMAINKQKADLASQAQDKTVGLLPGLMGSLTGGANGGNGSGGTVPYPGGATPQQSQAAVEAEFARSKDTAGQIAKSALTGLSDNMSARGMAGSGAQGEEAAKIINHQAGGLADLNREQAIQGLQYTQHANDTQYQGDITQRAQSMGLVQSLLGLMRSGVAY